MKKLLCITAIALAASSANAEFFSGNTLLGKMKGNQADQAMALGYVVGAHDLGEGIIYCTPATITAGKIHDMVRQLLEARPDARHQAATTFIVESLKSTWPCAQKKGAML